jgi:signal transduction histidine kinase/ligand-binding sensor domain-containing protein
MKRANGKVFAQEAIGFWPLYAFFALTLILGPGRAAFAHNVELRDYSGRLWQAQDGLPDQDALAFAETQDGSLWIGTLTGLLRFDGAAFFSLNQELSSTEPNLGVNCLLASRDGSLWIGTNGSGLARYRDKKFTFLPSSEGLTNQFVKSLYEDSSGSIWVGSDQGLYRVVGGKVDRVDRHDGVPPILVRSVVQDPLTQHIWAGGSLLMELSSTLSSKQYRFSGKSAEGIISLAMTRDGVLWAGATSGLWRLSSSGIFSRIPEIKESVTALYETKDGALLVGTLGGLYVCDHGRVTHPTPAGLPSTVIGAIFEDAEGSIWIGTPGGILQLSRTPIRIIPLGNGALPQNQTIFRDTDGSILVTVANQIFRIHNGVSKPYTLPGLPNIKVRTLFRDTSGALWVGTEDSGLYRIQGQTVRSFAKGRGLINDSVSAIMQDSDGSIWVSTDAGISQIGTSEVEQYDDRDLAYPVTTALFQDRTGGVWVGTYRGLSHIIHGSVVHDAATQALAQEQVFSINQDTYGELWIGTNNGLYGFKDGKVVHVTAVEGLSNNAAAQIIYEPSGTIWLAGPTSISAVKSSDLDDLADGRRSHIALTHYLDARDLWSASIPYERGAGGFVAPNGDLWLASDKGALRVVADELGKSGPFSVAIDKVTADGRPIPIDDTIHLQPGNGRLEISYGAIRLRSQEGIRYQYEMEGLDAWNQAFGRRTAYFTNLPPGKYRFRVQVFEVGNPNAISEASIYIEEARHFYQTGWFLCGSALGLIGLSFAGYRLRVRSIKQRFRAITTERARLAREMHDTVIQGCVGVSALLEASLEVSSSDKVAHTQLLTYASEQMTNTIEAAREAVWSLRSVSSSAVDLGSLCSELGTQFQANHGVSIECKVIGVPPTLNDATTHELMMTVREALTNAVIHAHATRIQILVRIDDESLEIDVSDNGYGFDHGVAFAQAGHYGLLGMEERVQLLGGKFAIESRPGHGTLVRIALTRGWKKEGSRGGEYVEK